MSETRVKGTVKWFNAKKGYGFIENEQRQGEDFFAHYKEIRSKSQETEGRTEYRCLNRGDKVEFDIIEGKNGYQAADIVTLATAEVEPA